MPAPAEAVRMVSEHHGVPWAISLVIRGRGSAQSGTPGAVIFDGIGAPETVGRASIGPTA